MERKIGIADQLFGIIAIVRRNRDTDRRADDHALTFDRIRL